MDNILLLVAFLQVVRFNCFHIYCLAGSTALLLLLNYFDYICYTSYLAGSAAYLVGSTLLSYIIVVQLYFPLQRYIPFPIYITLITGHIVMAEWLRRRKAVSRYSMKRWKYKKQVSGHLVTKE